MLILQLVLGLTRRPALVLAPHPARAFCLTVILLRTRWKRLVQPPQLVLAQPPLHVVLQAGDIAEPLHP